MNVYWCTYLNKGGLGCIESDKEWSKLVKYFGTEDGVFEMLPLDLLFDGCKHCGVNCDEEGEMYEEESSTNSNSIIL